MPPPSATSPDISGFTDASPRLRSFGRVLDANNGIGPGFDFLRIVLALSIVGLHASTVTGQYYPLDDTPVWMIHYALVPMFFALSGFLVTASAQRLSLRNFLLNRALRILPALAVDTMVCALIIGPLFTTVALSRYFGSGAFYAYFLNMFGWVHFTLPGVFDHFPVARVNGSLWTVPFELMMYAMISVLMITGSIARRSHVALLTAGYILLAVVVQGIGIGHLVHGLAAAKVVSIALLDYEAQAVTAFLFGIIAYQNRYAIVHHRALFAGSLAVLLATALLLTQAQGQLPVLRILLIPLIVYITLFIGLSAVRPPRFLTRGDYSYGIYLYHQPLLQVILSLFPVLAFAPHWGAGFTFIAGLPLVFGVAFLSWHCVERPTLALRKRFSQVARLRDFGGATST